MGQHSFAELRKIGVRKSKVGGIKIVQSLRQESERVKHVFPE